MTETPPRGFSSAEFAHRIERAQRAMRAQDLDALVLTTPHNIRWATGFDTQFWESPTRPWFVVVPADSAPLAVVPEIGAAQMAETWIEDVRSWPSPRPEDDGTSLLISTLDALPRRTGRIGFELGLEMALRMPVAQFLELRERLRGLELCDGSPAIWPVRMIKTDAEIAHIRHICTIASDAYDRVPALVQTGMTERAAARALRAELAECGADATPFLPAISGPGGVSQIICGPGERELQQGDVLFFDTGSTFDGYWCDFDRNYAIGTISDAAHRAHDAMWRATEAGLAAARPGATCEDLFRVMATVIEDAGAVGNTVGRLGHGLGMQLTEPPSHRLGDRTVLETGMVLTIEPGIEYAPGKMIVHEENIVLRPDGAELLTRRAPPEMARIG
ncbi:MAG: Xaa-Pro peptidase family protein [Pseudomonadota bacterium]